MTSNLQRDALAISESWMEELHLGDLVQRRLDEAGLLDVDVDVVAIGKASGEMAGAVRAVLGPRVQRQLIVTEARSGPSTAGSADEQVGEHPVPGPGSVAAGHRLVEFLQGPTLATCTLFLISGGASSLCALPEPPMTLGDLHEIWRAALAAGLDITSLNQLRAATSSIAGGAILRHVRTPRSRSLIMVDNVVSGPRWVASGLTYDYAPPRSEVEALVARLEGTSAPLAATMLQAFEHRAEEMAVAIPVEHDNLVVAEPLMLLDLASAEASRRGYRVVNLGGDVQGDVAAVATRWSRVIEREAASGDRFCVLGVGEVTVKVRGSGVGGRCQEFAWRMAGALAESSRPSVFVARASDGRDFVAGVAGAWVDETTLIAAASSGLDWFTVLGTNDSHRGLEALDQLIDGQSTGWNLCDIYLAVG